MNQTVVIAIDGPSASGKSTNARIVAKALGYAYVDTGAMFRTLAWYCLTRDIDVMDGGAVASACRKWKTRLECIDGQVRLTVDGYYPEKEIRTEQTSAAVPRVAPVLPVRAWMKDKQRECVKFGNLVMEGRDIGSVIFPETDFKFYIDASFDARMERRLAEGVNEDLARRDKLDSERKVAPLMVPLGADFVDTSKMTKEESSGYIIDRVRQKLAARQQQAVQQ